MDPNLILFPLFHYRLQLKNHKLLFYYKDFCNYFYLAIPPYEEMIKAAETDFPSDTGILVCDCENNEIKVIRKATRQNPRHISQDHAVAIFKQSV